MKLTSEWIDVTFASESGAGNGSATDFALTYTPKSNNSIWVTVNGLQKIITVDYTVDLPSKTISFVTAPAVAQTINVKYLLA